MKQITRLVDAVSSYMQLISGLLLVSMMVTVLLDVTSRALFRMTDGGLDLTFIGGIELIKFGLLFTVLFALPYCVDKSQVVVDLFTEKLTDPKKAFLESIYFVGYAVLGTGMTIRFYHAIGNAAMSGETTQDLLIPMNYIYVLTTFATAVLAIRSLLVAKQRLCTAMGYKA
ncbi:TRAP transporter small permease [Marinobacterium sp. D7]|uniref:TRAP transporter small permease n=1 Tax=Marinobacterium ramblicola TaxID=2849041 RepID=UPI001C2CE3D8|nr:TRAP transporter small permease subunit [Marinobacterium ramblicola]MBV1789751.1 TRAP transporter small permease [Marinobacterium ramblicola]